MSDNPLQGVVDFVGEKQDEITKLKAALALAERKLAKSEQLYVDEMNRQYIDPFVFGEKMKAYDQAIAEVK